MDGSFVPLAKTRAEREAKGDPRPSSEVRYRDKADYAARVHQAALALERDGYLLPEDVRRVQDSAAATPW